VVGSGTSVTVSYSPSALNGAVLNGYKILYDDGMAGAFQEAVVSSTSDTEFEVDNLTPGLPYRFAVVVTSEVGDSDPSDPITITVGAPADPPSAPYYVASTNNQLDVAWDFTGSNGGATITQWNIYMSSSVTASTFPAQGSPSATSIATDRTLTVDCTNVGGLNLAQNWIYFRVAAVTDASIGQYSPISWLFCAQAPDAPTVTDDAGSANSVTFSWAEGNLYGAELLAFKLNVMDNQVGTSALTDHMIYDTSVRSYVLNGLTANREYLVQVNVISTVTEGAANVAVATRSCGVPSTPAAPTRTSSTDTTITLAWQAPNDNGCSITGYRLFRDNDQDGVTEVTSPQNGPINDQNDPNLNPTFLSHVAGALPEQALTASTFATRQYYGFQVRAYNTFGFSDSAWVYFEAAGEPEQMDPPSQNVLLSSTTQIQLTWTVPNLNSGTAVGYKVFRNTGSGTAISTTADPDCGMEASPAPQTCTITGLAASEEYSFQMLTINHIGEGALSNVAILKAATRPSTINQPVNSEGDATTPKVKFTWVAPADNGATIYNYEWEIEDLTGGGGTVAGNGGGTAGAPFTATEYEFDGTAPYAIVAAQQYKFRVRAINEMSDTANTPSAQAAWSAWSSTTVAPKGYAMSAPDACTNLARSADAPVNGQVKLTWDGLTLNGQAGGDDVNTIEYKVYGALNAPYDTLLTTITGGGLGMDYTATVPSGEAWTFYLVTENRAGLTGTSGQITLISAAVPAAPALTATSPAANTVQLDWTLPNNNGAIIQEYRFSITNDAGMGPDIFTSPPTATTRTFVNANNAGQMFFQGTLTTIEMKAVNAVGESLITTVQVTVSA
jgi:hypothetical protein